jgi:hypothetical protein
VLELIEPSVGAVDFVRESLALFRGKRAPAPAYEEREAKLRFQLRDGSTDMRLTDAERLRGPRDAAVTDHGAEQVDVGWIQHA